ncbi:MAG TPA: MFS transporter [Pyrinomonadaceae bacterium]|nr:MFS transporter [Pyrinomonadaceae bacterium]
MSAEAGTVGRGRRGAGAMFRALAQRNFRLFWAGSFLSNVGVWMQGVAQGWLVYELTDSPFWLGIDGLMATAPGLLLTLVGGVFADLVDRKRLLILTQAGAGLSALILAVLVWTGVVADASDVWVILLLSFFTGACWAIAGPSYQAITSDLVRREDLSNAIALNSTQFQLSRVIGPLLAGLTIQHLGMAGCFFANALSYVAIVAALARVRFGERRAEEVSPTVPPTAAAHGAVAAGETESAAAPAHALPDRRALWRDLVEGFRYAAARPRVRVLLVCSLVVSLFGTPYLVLMPVFARDVFGWDEKGLSLLTGSAGAGAFCGAVMLTYLGDFPRKGRFVLASSFAASLCIMGFALAAPSRYALALIFAVGFGMVCFFAVSNMLLQQLVTDAMRGRVLSMWLLTFVGTMPLGNFLAGLSAERFSAPATLVASGAVIAVFIASVALFNARLREI